MKKVLSVFTLIISIFMINPNEASAEEIDLTSGKYKIFYNFIPAENNNSSVMKVRRVDFTTGAVKTDEIPFPEDNFFISYQSKSKQNLLVHGSTLDRKTLLTYDFKKQKINVLRELGLSEGTIDAVYPDSKMYVVKKSEKEYEIYSLTSHRLYSTVQSQPKLYDDRNPELNNVPLYLPEPEVGDLVYDGEPRLQDYNGQYMYRYTGGNPVAIKPNGKVVTLTGTKNQKLYMPGYVYKKYVGNVIYKRSITPDRKVVTELIYPDGTRKTLYSNSGKGGSFLDQFSPNHKLMISFVTTGDYTAEYRVYEVSTGKLINTFDVSNVRVFSNSDLRAIWTDNEDNHFRLFHYSPLRNLNAYSDVEIQMASSILGYHYSNSYLLTFDTSRLLTNQDPFPIMYNGEYVKYTGQGSFRVMDGIVYTPVKDLMTALEGKVSYNKKEITVSRNGNSYQLDSSKMIMWDNQVFFPLKEIASALKLKVTGKALDNGSAYNSFAEFELSEY